MNRSFKVLVFAIFFLLPIVVTITHECGHILMAWILGYHTVLHHSSMDWSNVLYNETTAPYLHRILITMAGIAETWLTAIIGLLILWRKPKQFWVRWLGIVLSMFAVRNAMIMLLGIVKYATGHGGVFGGDELMLSLLLGMPKGMMSIVLGLISYFVCYWVFDEHLLKEEKKPYRYLFLLGCTTGYFFWYYILGPQLLP